MKRPDINCQIGLDDPWDMVKKQYIKNLLEFADIREPVCCIGPITKLYNNLTLDGKFKTEYPSIAKTYFVVDIIESELNPLDFFYQLQEGCDKNTKIYVTCPYRWNSYFWNWNHWHEIDPRRFKYLIEQSGFKITRMMKKKIWHEWWWYFRGIRPFLRLLFVPYNHYYYELMLK